MAVNWDAVNELATWSALALTLTQLGRDEVRRRKAELDKEGGTLRLDVRLALASGSCAKA